VPFLLGTGFLEVLMKHVGFLLCVALAAVPVASEAQTPAVPRTSAGRPDLQGVWANNSATPLERPDELTGREVLTEMEVAALTQRAGELFSDDADDAAFGDAVFLSTLRQAESYQSTDGVTDDAPAGTGNYNHFWLVERNFDNRTSVIVDPPDGRIPPLTPQAQKKEADAAEYRRLHPADGPEDLPVGHRCVTRTLPRLLAGYNSYFQIVQTPGYVAIVREMIHETRIIPVDERPHLGPKIRQWSGNSRGHWEGDTLVVDTTDFSPKANFRGSSEDFHLVERFTRVDGDTIHWEVTMEDPTTWTAPWTAAVVLQRTEDPVFEYACHEGNEGMAGTLAGHRAQEKVTHNAETDSK